jgi:hypothetical protein
MKIAFGMIVFEGDYVLKQCLEQVYPFAEQILNIRRTSFILAKTR